MACVRFRGSSPLGSTESGEVPERLIGAVSKNAMLAKVSGVRILPSPSMFNFKKEKKEHKFSVSFLYGNDDGLVITSFYTREGNRVYGKPIKQSVSQYALSKEETKAIEMAKKYGEQKPNNNQAPNSGGSGSH